MRFLKIKKLSFSTQPVQSDSSPVQSQGRRSAGTLVNKGIGIVGALALVSACGVAGTAGQGGGEKSQVEALVNTVARARIIPLLNEEEALNSTPSLSSYIDEGTFKENFAEAMKSVAQSPSPAQGEGKQAGPDSAKKRAESKSNQVAGGSAAAPNPYGKMSPYKVDANLSNVVNAKDFEGLTTDQKRLLEKNNFVIGGNYGREEFFDIYESNRYTMLPNFVTVDSMMHSYHLFFQQLQKSVEKTQLTNKLATMSKELLAESQAQLTSLAGTEWEKAATRNVAFFAVAAKLLSPDTQVPQKVSNMVASELQLIQSASGSAKSPLLGKDTDYSQYQVRGYYEKTPQLQAYFKAMMWYGNMHFTQKDEELDRSALLATLAISNKALKEWETIYTTTAFFAGESDDSGYYEYLPMIHTAYGKNASVKDLPKNDAAWKKFHELTAKVTPPRIATGTLGVVDKENTGYEEQLGFRVMGQRFTLDQRVFSELLSPRVKANPAGEDRVLPDALDVPNVLGSTQAQTILKQQGATEYAKYNDNVEKLRKEIANDPNGMWTGSLSAQWLYTLNPLLASKGEGYPSFMTSSAWDKKTLQSYLSSYTELKHDTVLYAKQVMAEMGGGPIPEKDDRGYVEPEPELYTRLAKLAKATSEGLERYGLISDENKKSLGILAQLSTKLADISVKELSGEKLSNEDYELIRTFGGQLEHFWVIGNKDGINGEPIQSLQYPASLVTDIATSNSGEVLHIGTGAVNEIFVVFPIDGELHIASGGVSSFYEFTQGGSRRMTDTEWQEKVRSWDDQPTAPAWLSDIQAKRDAS